MNLLTVDGSSEVPALLASAAVAGRTDAVFTYYNDATGERTELSAQVLGGWVARTANLLTDGCGLGHGDRAAVLLPPHWQTAAVLLGTWAAGISVDYRSWATAGLPLIGAGSSGPFDATFVALDRLNSMLEDTPEGTHRFVLGPGPVAAGLPAVPVGFRDYLAEVQHRRGEFRGSVPLRRSDAATVDGTTYEEWGFVAQEMAVALDLLPGDRVLVNAADHEHPLKWLLAPLTAGASVVLCANLDPGAAAARIEAERITRVL